MSDATEAQTQFAVGNLSGTVSGLITRVTSVEHKMDGLDTKLDVVLAHIERQKGAKAATYATASLLATAFGAAASAVVAWFLGRQ